MLVLTETFAEQTPRAAARHCAADFPARDDPQFGRRAGRQPAPIDNETALRKPFAVLPDAREIPVLPESRVATQTQASGVWRSASGVWGPGGHDGLNRRQAFAAFAAAVAQCGAATLGGFAGEKPVLPFAPDFRRLILAFHKLASFREKNRRVGE